MLPGYSGSNVVRFDLATLLRIGTNWYSQLLDKPTKRGGQVV